MDKNAIKKYAVWARRELIERVAKKAQQYGIEENAEMDANADSINGILLTPSEKKERQALITQISDKGYEQVMEEVAYTWFNRFSALRFMEVNGYLPSHVRVFTDEENNFKPQILAEAIHLEIDGLDMNKVYELKEANKTDELYKYLLITQCNALSSILPRMFQKIADYSELLLPDNLLREGSAIEQMISLIPEEDWKDAVQIIGWLYQYYNTEKKDEVFAALKKNVKITKDNIPAATQLFTPDWIVRYMVENSLGRLWVEGNPNDELKSNWKYYLDEAKQEENVQKQLDEIRNEYKNLKPEEIKCIDPCSGSGHILAYMFDVLMQIYEVYGYTSREAVENIVKNNIYGLDIDERAAQLANFAVMMKARQYDRRFFTRKDEDGNLSIPQPNVYAICESNHISKECLDYFTNEDAKIGEMIHSIVDEMQDAKEYGSILNISAFDFDSLMQRFDEVENESEMSLYTIETMSELLPIVKIANILQDKYQVVITNPPYMNSSGMAVKLADFVKKNYPKTKIDLSTVFMEKALNMTLPDGYVSMINIPVWMSLASCEAFRKDLINNYTLTNMLHFGRGVFGSDFGSTGFVISNNRVHSYNAVYRKLYLKQGSVDTNEQKEKYFFEGIGSFITSQDDFKKVPGHSFAYQLSSNVFEHFTKDESVGKYGVAKQGLITGDNERFLRLWFEVAKEKFTDTCQSRENTKTNNITWYPYNKGGDYRKWYGNCVYAVNWENDGFLIQNFKDGKGKLRSRPQNMDYYFKNGLTWTALTAGKFSMRFSPNGYLFDAMGATCFFDSENKEKYVLGFLNSCVGEFFLRILCPNLKFDQKPLENVPLIVRDEVHIVDLVNENIALAKADWDSLELSWNYKKHPLIRNCSTIESAYCEWSNECTLRFEKVKENEEEMNKIFIRNYGLENELDYHIEDADISIRKADKILDVKSLISYIVGCMFGRYSLDEEGLIYAGENWDVSKYKKYSADQDNIIPICSDEYFEDDIVGRFVEFIKVVYGEDTLQENLRFISDSLNGKGSPMDVLRDYFISEKGFYFDHCINYSITGSGKRPIYWLFDSGKKGGFKALIYMHRYQQDTIARMRTDYVHEQQGRYRTEITDIETRIASASTSDRVKLNKELAILQDKSEEIRLYEEKIHHLADQMIHIDLDDGVKNNYAIFQDVLAKIK